MGSGGRSGRVEVPGVTGRVRVRRVAEAAPEVGGPGLVDEDQARDPFGAALAQAGLDGLHQAAGLREPFNVLLVGVDLASIRREVESTIDHLRSTMGDEAWQQGMFPEVPEVALVESPYQYQEYHGAAPASRPAGEGE